METIIVKSPKYKRVPVGTCERTVYVSSDGVYKSKIKSRVQDYEDLLIYDTIKMKSIENGICEGTWVLFDTAEQRDIYIKRRFAWYNRTYYFNDSRTLYKDLINMFKLNEWYLTMPHVNAVASIYEKEYLSKYMNDVLKMI